VVLTKQEITSLSNSQVIEIKAQTMRIHLIRFRLKLHHHLNRREINRPSKQEVNHQEGMINSLKKMTEEKKEELKWQRKQ